MHIITKMPEFPGVLAYFVQKGNMRKTILLLSLCLSLSALAADNVERAAVVPQRLLPTGNTTQQSSQQRNVLQRNTDGDATITGASTSGGTQSTVAGRTAVVREKPVVRTATSKSVVTAQPSGEGNVVRSVVTRFTPSSVNSGSRANDPQTSAGLTGKVGTGLTARGTSKNTRISSAESAAAAKATMESLSELTETCRNSYYECMDNFCNIIDEEMGRCACSKNIRNYEKTKEALATATKELQEVSQKIQYLGLTPKEITTLFTETSSEKVLGQNIDNTTLKNDLERIRGMIVDVNSGTSASSVSDSSDLSMDLSNLLDFNVSSTSFDIGSLFNTSGNTQSISNQRGESLYKSAVSRCKSGTLTKCSQYGVDTATIINSYDVEIDKDCMAYERKLTDENTAMLSTIRNAKVVLQKARLMVAQQKNEYDLRSCISALDSCMQDEFVCGTDYENCLDPTGKYIVKGNVVMGSMPGPSGASGMWNGSVVSDGLYTAWNYDGKNIYATNDNYNVKQYILDTMDVKSAKNSTAKDVSRWLQNRMGWHDDATGNNHGLCVAILNKCQKYSYDDRGKYFVKDGTKVNPVIQSWLETAFKKIKQGQDRVLANYARGCISEVTQCLSQNNFYGTYVSSTSESNPTDIAIRSCLPTINTCRSVTLGLGTATVSSDDLSNVYAWLNSAIGTTYPTWDSSSVQNSTVYEATITLDHNGGSGGTTAIYTTRGSGVFTNVEKTAGMSPTENCITPPTKTGFDFLGYFGSLTNNAMYIDGGGCITNSGLSVGLRYNADKTWFARFANEEYTITLDSKYYNSVNNTVGTGPTTAPNPTSMSFTYGTGSWFAGNNEITSITIPVYTGYIFGGFYTGKTGTGQQIIGADGNINIEGSKTFTAQNTTLYAKWTSVCGEHKVLSGNQCVCESGYTMVYNEEDESLYCVEAQIDPNLNSNVTSGDSAHACVIKDFLGASLQPGNGRCVTSQDEFPDYANWWASFDGSDNDRVYGMSACVDASAPGLHTGYQASGQGCSCWVTRINNVNYYTNDYFYQVLIGSVGGSCDIYCPATCAYRMAEDSDFRKKMLTPRQ